MESPFLTNDEAASYLKLAARSLEKFRVQGTGPRYVKAGRRVLYRRDDLDAWAAARLRGSTSEAA